MQLLDLNQVILATLHSALGKHISGEIDMNGFRNMVANSIRSHNVKFRNEFGNMVLVSDSWEYWRKQKFPYYKAARKKNREKSEVNWPAIFECMNTCKEEIQEYYPYKYICVKGAEADDIIGTLAREATERVLIISGDTDFMQLHSPLVQQYDPRTESFLRTDNPKEYLFEHIIRGDSGDGIPNIYSPDDHYVNKGPRAKPVTPKRLAELRDIENQPESPHYPNFIRNKTLIDLSMTPPEIQEDIRKAFSIPCEKKRSHLQQYMMKFRLKDQLEKIGQF